MADRDWKQWAVPLGVAAIGSASTIAGQASANDANLQQAREQMLFQERMSNSQAIRAVRDYQQAGLNPALAYDKTASSPSGASATFGNVAGGVPDAINSGMKMREQMKLLDQQEKNLEVQNSYVQQQGRESQSRVGIQDRQARALEIDNQKRELLLQQMKKMQPYELRKMIADTIATELGLTAARNDEAVERAMGPLGKGVERFGPLVTNTARSVVEMRKGMRTPPPKGDTKRSGEKVIYDSKGRVIRTERTRDRRNNP